MQRNYIESLTSLRGIAAILILLDHFAPFFPVITSWGLPIKNHLWVDFFFILSGFVISLNYGELFTNGFNKKEYRIFMTKRLIRIYPVHVITLGAMILVELYRIYVYIYMNTPTPDTAFGLVGDKSFPAIIYNLLLINSWGIYKYFSWNQPAWSISCEFFAYLIFPFLVSHLWRIKHPLLGICILIIVYFVIIFLDTTTSLINYSLLRCVSGFSCGILLCRIYLNNPKGIGYLSNSLLITAILLLSIFYLYIFYEDIFIIPLFCLLIILISFNRGYITKFLNFFLFQYLGKISYSLYMWHFIMLNYLDLVALKYYNKSIRALSPELNAKLFICFLIITILISSISYYLFEYKLAKILLRRLKGWL